MYEPYSHRINRNQALTDYKSLSGSINEATPKRAVPIGLARQLVESPPSGLHGHYRLTPLVSAMPTKMRKREKPSLEPLAPIYILNQIAPSVECNLGAMSNHE